MEAYKGRYTGPQIDALLDQVSELAPAAVKDYELYGFKKCVLDQGPFSRIIYMEDNKNFTPASMDYRTGQFNYGDWASAFFMQIKPVMLGYDGKVKEELDPNNYKKKKDGSVSSNIDPSFAGNCMIGFPTVWVKRKQYGIWQYTWICSKQLDEDFHAYAHTNSNGDIIPYFYYPAYNGSVISDVMRSISNAAPTVNTTVTQEVAYAVANNPSGKSMWYTNVTSDRMLINDLLTLIGKSSNAQAVFGMGHYTGGSNASHLINSGTMDDKGLFWGSQLSGYGVKVFGIENYYGNRWDRIAGWIYNNSGQYVKLTYGTEDGSTVTGYNQDGNGYIFIPNSVISGTNGGYIRETYANDYGVWPINSDASDNTFECDGIWYDNSKTDYAFVGGGCDNGLRVGPGCSGLDCAPSGAGWNIGGSTSCKPELAA